jgi:DHA2 family multidrug resistance protein-like MFS transporter
MAALLVLGPRFLPEFKDPRARRLDIISAALSLGAILSVIYGVKQVAQDGWQLQPIFFVAAGIALGLAFLQRQRKLEDPLVDLRLFRLPTFNAALITYLLGIFVAFGVFLFLSQYLQLVLGLTPLEAGLWMLPWALAFVVGSTLTPKLVRRVRPVPIIVGGLAVAAAGFGLLVQIDESTSFLLLATGLVISSLGLAPVFTLATDIVVGSAPPERAGSAAAISETTGELGGALGIAVLGSVGTAVYRTELARAIPDVPSRALDTLGGAVNAAQSLSGNSGSLLLEAARGAFIHGLQLSILASVVIAVITAVLVAVALRNVKKGSERNEKTDIATDGAA